MACSKGPQGGIELRTTAARTQPLYMPLGAHFTNWATRVLSLVHSDYWKCEIRLSSISEIPLFCDSGNCCDYRVRSDGVLCFRVTIATVRPCSLWGRWTWPLRPTFQPRVCVRTTKTDSKTLNSNTRNSSMKTPILKVFSLHSHSTAASGIFSPFETADNTR